MDLYEVGRITGIILFVYLVTGVIPDLIKKWIFRNKITIDIGKNVKQKIYVFVDKGDCYEIFENKTEGDKYERT